MQDTIAKAIVRALRVKLGAREERQLVRAPTTNSDAHALYLQGLYLWNRRTYQNIQQAISHFERAIAKDPKYAQAHAGVGMAYAVISNFADVNGGAIFARAEEAARRALAIDSTSAEAHAALGFAEMGLYHNASAERELRSAIRFDSSFATAHQWLGQLLVRARRFDEGIAESRRAHDLDPQSRMIFTSLSGGLYQARRYAEAERVVRQLREFDPSYANGLRNLMLILMAEGRNREAVDTAQQFLKMSGERLSWPVATLGLAYAANGQTAQARQLLNELLVRSERGPISAIGVALLYEALEDRENALVWLERGVAQYDPLHNWSRGPLFDGLRSDPRGATFLARAESPNDER